jgi:hypothetical protein
VHTVALALSPVACFGLGQVLSVVLAVQELQVDSGVGMFLNLCDVTAAALKLETAGPSQHRLPPVLRQPIVCGERRRESDGCSSQCLVTVTRFVLWFEVRYEEWGFGNSSSKSELHSRRNQEECKFGESLLPFRSEFFVFPSTVKNILRLKYTKP